MSHHPHITIFGAGCIGCYLAGILLPSYKHSPEKITLVGRETLAEAIAKDGLTITDYLGYKKNITSAINVLTSVDHLQPFTAHHSLLENTAVIAPVTDILLVTVKCTAIEENLAHIAKLVSTNTLIICLQNGIGSEFVLKEYFPHHTVLCGIVGFNSLAVAPSHFHRGTEGDVLIESSSAPHENDLLITLIDLFNKEQLPSVLVNNIIEIRWGKLLLNLNNAINALADIPLKAQLADRTYRKLLAKVMKEALVTLNKAKIAPAKLTAVSPSFLPTILSLPNGLFTKVANKMLAIDPLARSSMWHDLKQNKVTEVNYINGAVVELAKEMKINAPVNEALVKLIHQHHLHKTERNGLSAENIMKTVR